MERITQQKKVPAIGGNKKKVKIRKEKDEGAKGENSEDARDGEGHPTRDGSCNRGEQKGEKKRRKMKRTKKNN